ncbi:prepilin-type N-terminal cleavage/methylation domain-containing protein [Chloroflexota bacterium]
MKQRQRGFTLIEMVMVLGIVGAVSVAISMTTTTLLLNYKQPSTQQTLLQQVQNAGYQMPRDIQMSSNVTLSGPNGFPVTINIPVDQDMNNDYHVDYLLDGDKLKRQQFDSSDNLTTESMIAQYVDTGNTIFESSSEGLYKLTIRVSLDEETVTALYEAQRRLTAQ